MNFVVDYWKVLSLLRVFLLNIRSFAYCTKLCCCYNHASSVLACWRRLSNIDSYFSTFNIVVFQLFPRRENAIFSQLFPCKLCFFFTLNMVLLIRRKDTRFITFQFHQDFWLYYGYYHQYLTLTDQNYYCSLFVWMIIIVSLFVWIQSKITESDILTFDTNKQLCW